MRSSIAFAIVGAAVASAHDLETIFDQTTLYETVTACPPQITNCPGRSASHPGSVVPERTSTIYATVTRKRPVHIVDTTSIYTTICPATESGPTPTSMPSKKPNASHSVHSRHGSNSTVRPPVSTRPALSAAPSCDASVYVKAYTTYVPSIYYETVSNYCPQTSSYSPPPVNSAPPSNFTPPDPKPSGPVVVNAASALGSSALVVVAAGLLHFVMV